MSDEKITKMQLDMTRLEGKLDTHSEILGRVERGLNSHIDKEEQNIEEFRRIVKDFTDTADKKYASKRVEIIFWGGLGVIGTTLIVWAINVLLSHSK